MAAGLDDVIHSIVDKRDDRKESTMTTTAEVK